MKNSKEVEFIRNINLKYDCFIVWSKDLNNQTTIPLCLFYNYLTAKDYVDECIKDSHKMETYSIIGYNASKLFDSGFEVFGYI